MEFRIVRRRCLLLLAGIVLISAYPALASETQKSRNVLDYSLHVVLLSFRPGAGLEACRSYGRGTAGGNATVGHWVNDGNRSFGVTVECKMKSHRFWATVRIEPGESDTLTEAKVHELDLSEFRPQMIDMARDDDGRVYRLNLIPSVEVVAEAPKRFLARDQQLEHWSFPNCPIVFNDERYLGRISCSHGELAWLDIPGTALVEFSLLPFVGSEPWGVLLDGTIAISHPDGASVEINGVTNGVHQENLKGGPYQVWVRWKPPTHSLKEHQELVKTQVETLRKQIEAGDISLPAATVERLERTADSDGICLMSNGVRELQADERVPEVD